MPPAASDIDVATARATNPERERKAMLFIPSKNSGAESHDGAATA
jgi:hypothetical protein